MRKKILFICGSHNQTTQMHQIAQELPGYDHCFSPYYCDGILETSRKLGLIEFAIAGNRYVRRATEYIRNNNLTLDFQGRAHSYDLVVTCSDLVIPRNIRHNKIVLVQEGMTDPENFAYHVVRRLPFLPRWLASTSTTGLSHQYDFFCVASEGYKNLFIRKGVRPEKIVVTGIPNFDNCKKYLRNDFPYKNYVLVCTSDTRETFKWENRKQFILRAREIAGSRQLIFKLHPNERVDRATSEIKRYAPDALVFPTGNTEEMIANCDILITKFSSVVYVGLALGKEVYSGFNLEELKELTPIQNAAAARNIANVCRKLIGDSDNGREQLTGTANPKRPKALRRGQYVHFMHTFFGRPLS